MMDNIKTVSRIKIISNNISFGPMPDKYEEVEQHITLQSDGRYWVSRFDYGETPGKYSPAGRAHGRIFPGKEKAIFEKISVFLQEEITPMVTDCGEWQMTVTFEDGTKAAFSGALTGENETLCELSEMIRTELDMFDLFVFDNGVSNPYYDLSSIRIFERYLPLLYENTFLWNRFSDLCHSYFGDVRNKEKFFAFHRDPECIKTWLAMLDNMGGGIHLYFFDAAAFIILAYKEAGHDLDEELAACPREEEW